MFTGEHPCQSAISIKLQSIFIEIVLRHGFSPINLLHILRSPLSNNTSGRLFLIFEMNLKSSSSYAISQLFRKY